MINLSVENQRNSEDSQFSDTYYISQDLVPDQDYILSNQDCFNVKLLAQSQIPSNVLSFHMRSRYAQLGIDCQEITQTDNLEYSAMLASFHNIKLPEGIGIGNLYSPSPQITGEDLITLLSQEVLVDDEDVVLADTNGQILLKDGNETSDFHPDQLSLIGIKVNRGILYEIDSSNSNNNVLEIDHSKNLRESVAPFLKHIEGNAKTPFIVTTTRPVALGNVHLTLQTDLYNGIYHLPSVIIKPDSQWLPINGDESGIRLELATRNKKPFNPNEHQIPEYIFFSAHL